MSRLDQEDEAKNGFVDETLCLLPDIAEGLERYADFTELDLADLQGMNAALNDFMKYWRSFRGRVELRRDDVRQNKAEFGRRIDALSAEADTLRGFGYSYLRLPLIRLIKDLPAEGA